MRLVGPAAANMQIIDHKKNNIKEFQTISYMRAYTYIDANTVTTATYD